MKRTWKILRWVLAGSAILIAVVVAAVMIISHTARFNDFVRGQLVSYLNQTYRGEITVGRIQGSVWGSLTLHNITIKHGNSTIAVIPELRVGYYLLPALSGRIVLSDIDVIKPRINLERESSGQWNLLAALAERKPSPPSNMAVVLRRVGLEQGDISVTTAPGATYHVTGATIEATGHLNPSATTVDASKIAFALSGPSLVPIHANGAAQYVQKAQTGTIKVPNFTIRTARSHLKLNAKVINLGAASIDVNLKADQIAAADVDTIVPGAELASNLSGEARIGGRTSDLRVFASVAAGPSRIAVWLYGNLARSKPKWGGKLQLVKVDLHKLFKPARAAAMPGGEIDAIVKGNAAGTALASANGTIQARVAAMSMRGVRLGDLSFQGNLNNQAARLKAALAGNNGNAQLSGSVTIAKQPSYKLTLAVDHLRPARFVPAKGVPPADISLNATIDGTGYRPDTMRTRAQVRWLPSTVRGVRIDSGNLDAQISGGLVRIAAASFKAGATTAEAHGVVAMDPRRNGRLTYKIVVGQAADWLAMAGRRGGGSAEVSGQAQGNLHNLRATGSAQLTAFKVGNNSVEHARLTYDVGGLGKPLKPDGRLMLIASGVQAGVALKSLQTSVRLTPAAQLTADIDLSAENRTARKATLRAQVAYSPKRIEVNLTEAALGTAHGTWRMARPARLMVQGRTLEISPLTMANGAQSIAIEGTIAPAGAQNLSAQLKGLRVADFAGYLPRPVKIGGQASAELTVRGVAAAPVIALNAEVAGLAAGPVTNAALSARATYQDGRAQAEATFSEDPAHTLRATASLPLSLGWANGFEARPGGTVDLRAVSGGLDLAFLNAIVNPQLTGVGGTLSLDLTARGPIEHPIPSGYIQISGVHATNPKLNVEVTALSARMQLGPGELRLVSLSAKSGEGTMNGSGALTLLPSGEPGRVDVRVSFDHWPAAATHEMRGAVGGRVRVDGPLTALNVNGQVEVLWGVFRPVLSVFGGPQADDTITVVHRWNGGERARVAPPPPPPKPHGATFNSLAIHLDIVINRNTWIKTADFAVELEGKLHVRKKRNQPVIVAGTINSVRGTLVVAQREFNLTRGQITFTGGHEINPELDIVAQRRVQTYILSANVTGTAKKPALKLSSSPELPQADILSVMLFGKPTSQLTSNQQSDLANQAASMAGGYAATQVGQAVAEALGLGSLGVSVSGANGLGFGRYLTQNIYVSASQSTSNMQNRTAEVDYYVTPNISLTTSASTNSGNEIRLDWHKQY